MFRLIVVLTLLFASTALAQSEPDSKKKQDKPAATKKAKSKQEKSKASKKGKTKKARSKKKSQQDADEKSAAESASQSDKAPAKKAEEKKPLDTKMLAGALKFRSVGPAFMSGRIGDVAIDQQNPNTWYIAVASGGVWKTTNAGTTFDPIFDSQKSYSIGCVTVDPTNSSTVWVGTGENNGGCLLYTSPSPRDQRGSRMPSSA